MEYRTEHGVMEESVEWSTEQSTAMGKSVNNIVEEHLIKERPNSL